MRPAARAGLNSATCHEAVNGEPDSRVVGVVVVRQPEEVPHLVAEDADVADAHAGLDVREVAFEPAPRTDVVVEQPQAALGQRK